MKSQSVVSLDPMKESCDISTACCGGSVVVEIAITSSSGSSERIELEIPGDPNTLLDMLASWKYDLDRAIENLRPSED